MDSAKINVLFARMLPTESFGIQIEILMCKPLTKPLPDTMEPEIGPEVLQSTNARKTFTYPAFQNVGGELAVYSAHKAIVRWGIAVEPFGSIEETIEHPLEVVIGPPDRIKVSAMMVNI